jgi:anti-anti-sigma factor
MTSSAIGKLIALHRRVNRAEGRMILCELTPDVSATLDTSRLLGYFAVEPDLAAALYAMHAW